MRRYEWVRFKTIVILCFSNEYFFELILIDFLGRYADLDQHLNDLPQLSSLNLLPISFFLNLLDNYRYQFALNFWVEYHVSLEALGLQMLYTLQLYLWYVVLVHVHQYILYHDYRQLHFCPNLIDSSDKFLILWPSKSLHNRL